MVKSSSVCSGNENAENSGAKMPLVPISFTNKKEQTGSRWACVQVSTLKPKGNPWYRPAEKKSPHVKTIGTVHSLTLYTRELTPYRNNILKDIYSVLFIEALLEVVKTLEAKLGRWLSKGMAQHVKKLVAKSHGLSSIPGAHIVKGENRFLKGFLWPLHAHHGTHAVAPNTNK